MFRRKLLRASIGAACAIVSGFNISTTFAQGRKAILVGQTNPTTGPIAGTAAAFRDGARAFVEALNAQGGINGRELQIETVDDNFRPDTAEKNARDFARKGAVCFFQPWGESQCLAMSKMALELKIPLLAPISGASSLYEPTPYLFNTRASWKNEYEKIVQQLLVLGLTKLSMVHMDNQGGRSALAIVEEVLARNNLKLAATFGVKNDASNAADGAQRIGASQAKVVIYACTTSAAIQFLKAYQSAGYRSQSYFNGFTDGQSAFKTEGALAVGWVISQVALNPFSGESVKLTADYRRDMRNAGLTELSYNSVEGYTNAKVLATALRRINGEPTAAGLRTALENLGMVNLGGYTVNFSTNNHAGSRHVELVLVGKDGRYVR